VTADAEYEAAVLDAESELQRAQSAEDVRRVWSKHFGKLGHRTLGRLLIGRPAKELLDRRAERQQGA
jgi:hypothetical protein